MRPNELVKKLIKTTKINNYYISRIEVDLKHVNYGLNKKKEYNTRKRSNFAIDSVVKAFESLSYLELEVESDDFYDYFVVDNDFFDNGNVLRMVFCIERSHPTTAGVITLYTTRRSSK